MTVTTPEWVKHAVFYQIFPDRFYRSPRSEDLPGVTFKPWGTPPEEQGYQGGDLRGIVDKLDYLKELGITALYLNPIFSSASNHRYHAFDYMQVDPLLGGNEALRELLDEAHKRGIRVVLDGVFNHASRGFWAFHHILENGEDSPYLDWFTIEDFPLRPYTSDEDNPPNYAAWWGLPALPKLNTDNPGVRQYIMEVAKYWIDFGIDGWRLDVPAEIDDDEFWQKFRQVVKGANPEAYIVGEIWHEAQRWLKGDQFDAVMNYFVMKLALNFFGAETLRTEWEHEDIQIDPLDAEGFAEGVDEMINFYDPAITYAQLNMLDSHDTPRLLWLVSEDKSALRLANLFMMTIPGAPCIYYGNEVGMSGKWDPYCRGAFPWDKEGTWDRDLLDFYKKAAAMRHSHEVLRTGDFDILPAPDGCFAFSRSSDSSQAVVIFNAGEKAVPVTIDTNNTALKPVWNEGANITNSDNTLTVTVPARDAVVLVG